MYRPKPKIRIWALVTAVLTVSLISACGTNSPSAGAKTVAGVGLSTVAPPGQVPLQRPTTAQGQPLILPTPNPGNTPWVERRVDAVIRLYRIGIPGAALLRSLDLRQMRGEPGFFGSYGFDSWTGVGEAKSIEVMHELSHAYWGGFPVTGRPDLGFTVAPGGPGSPAIQQYHADILTFMAQHPDGHEVLRQRLRNLPAISQDNTSPLFHNLEADLVYATGGHLALTPPILRKYWDRFLNPDPPEHLSSWDRAAAWFQALEGQDRATANRFLGFEHLDLRLYQAARNETGAVADANGFLEEARETIATEERQRLFDLADQFQLLLGDPQTQENFQFWRGYLRDKLRLHQAHPEYLASLNLTSSQDIAQALAFLSSIDDRAQDLSIQEQAVRLDGELQAHPFLVNFLPVLNNTTLLALFSRQPELPTGATLQATASFVERIERFETAVDQVLTQARISPDAGAKALAESLAEPKLANTEDIKLFFSLFKDAGRNSAVRIVMALDEDVFRGLMKQVPFQLRTLLTPEQLLARLGVSAGARPPELVEGITLLLEKPSGNFLVDEPFLAEMYSVTAGIGGSASQAALEILQVEGFPLAGFILQQPEAAARILGDDLAAAAELIEASDSVTAPPARIVYRLIYVDPRLGARLVAQLDETPGSKLAVESLAYLAYDDARHRRSPKLPISLERDGEFLAALLDIKGGRWLSDTLGQAFETYGRHISEERVAGDFLVRFQATLESAAAALPQGGPRSELETVILQVIRRYKDPE